MGEDPYGGWIKIDLERESERSVVQGELIAVDEVSVYVLPLEGDGRVVRVSRSEVRDARVETHASGAGGLAAWTIIGTVSTASHGGFLLLTAPLWLISGTASAAVQSGKPMHDFPEETWRRLAAFARFPQGPPAGLGQMHLSPKARDRSAGRGQE
jgi:hypothetical protein